MALKRKQEKTRVRKKRRSAGKKMGDAGHRQSFSRPEPRYTKRKEWWEY